jgi:hypothetical protein
MRLEIEWVAKDTPAPVFSDALAFSLEFEDWQYPLPRVGDAMAPPECNATQSDSTEWLVSSVTWEFAGSNNVYDVDLVRIVVHEEAAQ